MNKIHDLDATRNYFVTLDYPQEIAPSSIIYETVYRHPIISQVVRDMQADIYGPAGLQSHKLIKFCGSYFHSQKIGPDLIGSHEAGFSSGTAAAAAILRELAPHGVTASART
jgi:predicted NAD/FAD-binding protein